MLDNFRVREHLREPQEGLSEAKVHKHEHQQEYEHVAEHISEYSNQVASSSKYPKEIEELRPHEECAVSSEGGLEGNLII
jgi:hypothetical protein